jgi:hypothetical protein
VTPPESAISPAWSNVAKKSPATTASADLAPHQFAAPRIAYFFRMTVWA